MTAEVILHLANPDLAPYRAKPGRALYPMLQDVLLARGARVRIVARRNAQMAGGSVTPDGNLHIVETGWCYGRGWMSAATAYLEGFWHLGEEGVLANSPARHESFDPGQVAPDAAQDFAATLRARFSDVRQSRYRQHRLAHQDVPQGAIAVFLQGPTTYRREQAFVSAAQMLRIVAEQAGGRPVVVKAHPLTPEFGRAAIAKVRDKGFDLIETEANVHDILSRAAVTVSVNSAVAFEGFLHGVPAILFGRSDFHSLTETVLETADYPAALARALTRAWDFPGMLYWYFDRHTLWAEGPDFEPRLLARLADAGFDAARLGLRAG